MLALNISFNFLIDNGIDMEAMELLGVTQIEKLVPLLGPQLKLIKKWKAHVSIFSVAYTNMSGSLPCVYCIRSTVNQGNFGPPKKRVLLDNFLIWHAFLPIPCYNG